MTDYIELHAHSCYSLLDGASSPEDLITQAAQLNMPALALTDHDGVYGVVPFIKAAKKQGIRPILGAELTLEHNHHLTLLVKDKTGWYNLCRLITIARHNASKGEAVLPDGMLCQYTDGLIALSGCRKGAVVQAMINRDYKQAAAVARQYSRLFGEDNFWIELQRHRLPGEQRHTRDLVQLANYLKIGVVATNNVHYAIRERHQLQDVLVSIRHNCTLDEALPLLRPNSEYSLKSAQQMQALFADIPQAVANTQCIAEQCQFELEFGTQELPPFPTPDELDAHQYLRQLCLYSVQDRAIASDHLLAQLDHELTVIQRTNLSNYFLIVHDIVRFAKDNGILCQGRGSAANSLVAFLLGISLINPLEHDLVFERFLSEERQVVPDIDIDFQADRREEVIQYIYRRYGHERAAMACNLVTFRARSALRDVSKAMGLSADLIDRIATALDVRKAGELDQSQHIKDILGTRNAAELWRDIVRLCRQMAGFPRHLGIHNGGFVITKKPLAARVPTEPATMTDRYVVQWDKYALEDVGLIKIDVLGLRMLSAIAEACTLIAQQTDKPFSLDQLTFDDPAVYEMITAADTVGIFQVESRAQTQVLPRLRPTCFNDLIVSISLIRPGPVQGDMVHPYLRRRLGEESVTYLHPRLEPALKETLGVILFQEQVLKVTRDLAGFSAGQGEQMRRALGSKNPAVAVEAFHETFISGAVQNGVDTETAELVFDKLKAFGGYSFPKSHAAAFAVLVYRSAWLKRYHPVTFYTALLNHQPMGFWSPAVLVNDARRHNIRVLPVDVNRSQGKCTVERDAIRIGFNYVTGFSDATSQRLVQCRESNRYASLQDFCQRTRLPRRLVEHLILAGALDAWGQRRQLLWRLGLIQYEANELNLEFPAEDIDLPELSDLQATDLAYSITGVATEDHLMARYRPQLSRQGILSSRALENAVPNTTVRVAGLNVVHQSPPTAKGHHFITLEDEFGFINVIVRPKVYARYRKVIRGASLLEVGGMVQKKGIVINVVAADLAHYGRTNHDISVHQLASLSNPD